MSDTAVRVIQEHLITGPRPGQCRCGWGSGEVETLGQDHSAHLVEQLRAAGLLAEPDDSGRSLQVQPGLGDQLLFVTAGDLLGGGRRVAWLARPEPLGIEVLGDRDRAVLRAFLTLALERLDALEVDIRAGATTSALR